MRVQGSRDLHQPQKRGLTFPTFTVGRDYVVCGIEDGHYRLVDDTGEPVLVPIDRFKVVDQLIPSSFITDDDSSAPAAFLVPGFFESWHDGDLRFRRLFDLEYKRLLADDAVRNGPLPKRHRH